MTRAAAARRLLAPAALVALALTAVRADGQDRPVLHEYVPDLASDEGTLLVSSGSGPPEAIVYDGELLPPPEPGPRRADEQALRAGEAPAIGGARPEEVGQRASAFHPDRVTELNGTVGYYTVFTPSIAPFKRVTALDRVVLQGGVPVLEVADRAAHALPVSDVFEEPGAAPRDRFWGSVVLDFAGGTTVPFPSVAPSSRILSLETDPPTPITIRRDAADNFYASADEGTRHEVRVTFLTDAPRAYFGQPIGPGPVGEHAADVPPLPPSVQADALRFASELGLDRQSELSVVLTRLTRHFRSFEESADPPANTGNIYLDLARGMRGICRHRAYAFVITAQALGMHARFVQNEAHAWTEVRLPGDAGWLRVDLGGAATGLETRGAGERPSYRAPQPDPLPRPPEYQRAYEEAARMNAQRPGGAGSDGATSGAGDAPRPPAPAPPSDQPTRLSGEVDASRGAISLIVDQRELEVFRGRELEVTGAVRGDGVGVEGLRVEVVLQAPRGDAEWLLGVTVSREAGRFRGLFGVPPDLPVGDYRLSVRTPGDARWGAAIAR